MLDDLGRPSVITKILRSGRGRQKKRSEQSNVTRTQPPLLALKMEEGTMSQGMWTASRKSKEILTSSSLVPPQKLVPPA